MTHSADSTPDDSDKKPANKAIAALPDTKDVDAFAPRAEHPATPRGWRARMLDYSAHAAMMVGLVGFAWTVGDHVVHRPAADAIQVTTNQVAAAQPVASDPLTELRSRNRELADSVRSLQARLDALQASVGDQGKVAAQVRVLQAALDNVQNNLGAARSEQAAVVARLDGKIDRLGRLEHSSIDPAPTASLPHAEAKNADAEIAGGESKVAAVRPVPRPADLKNGDKGADVKGTDAKLAKADEQAKPQVIANWVVRDVYQGVALIEGRRGTLEVVPGVGIPGAGTVKSIDRHGGGWTVTTTKGVVAYAAPPREHRRADRGGYYSDPGYRYDF